MRVDPSIRRQLAALTGGSSGTIEQNVKVNVDFDPGNVSKVTSAAQQLISELQSSAAKTKISPSVIMDKAELDETSAKLGLVRDVLRSISAVMESIKKNKTLIPNAKEQFGALGTLGSQLSAIAKQTRKGIELQFSPELAPVRAFDSAIDQTNAKINILNKNLEAAKSNTEKLGSALPSKMTAEQATSSRFREKLQAAKLKGPEREANLAAARAEQEAARQALTDAQRKLGGAKPTQAEIDNAKKSLTAANLLTTDQKSKLDAAKLAEEKLVTEGVKASLEPLEKRRAAREAELKLQKESQALQSREGKKFTKVEVGDVAKLQSEVEKTKTKISELSAARQAASDKLAEDEKNAQALYDRASSDYKANAKRTSPKGLEEATKTQRKALTDIQAKRQSLSTPSEKESKLAESLKSSEESLSIAKGLLKLKEQEFLATQNIKVSESELRAETEAIAKAQQDYNDKLAAAQAAVQKLDAEWRGAYDAQVKAQEKLTRLQDASKGSAPNVKTAQDDVDKKQLEFSAAAARVSFFETAGVDEQLLEARKKERSARAQLSRAKSTPLTSISADTESNVEELKKAVQLESQLVAKQQSEQAVLDQELNARKAILETERQALKVAAEKAKADVAAANAAEIAAKQAALDQAKQKRAPLQAKYDTDQQASKEEKTRLNAELAEAKKNYDAALSQLNKDKKYKSKDKKQELEDAFASSEVAVKYRSAYDAVATYGMRPQSPERLKELQDLSGAIAEENAAKKALEAAKALSSEFEKSAEYAKAVADNLKKVETAEENLRAIEKQRADFEKKSSDDKVNAVNRRVNAEKVLNQTLLSRVEESKKDLQVEKDIKGVVTEVTKIIVEAEASGAKPSTASLAKQVEVMATPIVAGKTADPVAVAQSRLSSATAERVRLEAESKKSGGIEASRDAAIKAAEARSTLSTLIEESSKNEAALEAQIASEQAKVTDLQKQQAEAAAKLTGNLKQDLELRRQAEQVVRRMTQAEESNQRKIAKTLGKAGIAYSPENARDVALRRLGVSEADIQGATPETVKKIRDAKIDAQQQRSEELAAASGQLDQAGRTKAIQNALEKLRSTDIELQKAADRQLLIQQRKPINESELDAKARAEAEKTVTREAANIASRLGVSGGFDNADAAQTVNILKEINDLINQYNAVTKEIKLNTVDVNNELARQAQLDAVINQEVEKEQKFRANIKTQLAKRGIQFDELTGQATDLTTPGAAPQQLLPGGASIRDIALRNLGIDPSSDVASALNNPSRDIRDLSGVLDVNALRSSQNYMNQARGGMMQGIITSATGQQRADDIFTQLRRVAEREAGLQQRKGTAQAPAQILQDLIKNVVGVSTGAETDARNLIGSAGFDLAQETALRRRLADAIEKQNQAIQEQTALERQQAAQDRTNQRNLQTLDTLIDQVTRSLEDQARAVNNLARGGARDALGNAIQPIAIDQRQLRDAARRMVLGSQAAVDPRTLSGGDLSNLVTTSQERVRQAQAQFRQFKDDIRAVTQGARSGFEIIGKYGDSAFERLGGRVGYATEKLAAYAFGGMGLYGVISITKQALLETALLEKEITNIQQIFDDGIGVDQTEDFATALKEATAAAQQTKTAILDISNATGQTALSIAQAAKDLAAAGFGRGTPGFEETIRAVSFAELGPSFGNQQQIIDGLIASVNQFNLSLAEAPYVLGLLNEYSKAFAVESQDLFEAIKRGGGAFASVGGNLEDYVKIVTIAREKTRESAPVIGTFLKTTFARLYTPRAEKLLSDLGIDITQVIDPYQRLYSLAEKFNKLNARTSASLLSEIVDSRSVGRLATILKALGDDVDKFNERAQNIPELATTSIARDAAARLDDIGPSIDRIRASYFRFVEGIYNNPATKALLRIPAGLGNLLSQLPELSAGGFSVGNFVNPAIQGGLAVGLTTTIRGAVRAFIQNNTSVRLNTEALNTLRASVDNLRGTVGLAAGAGAGAVGAAAGGAALGAGAANRGVLSRITGLNNPILTLGIASLLPGIVNSVLPMTNLSQDTQNVVSSTVQGGVLGGVAGSILTANPYGRAAITLGSAGLSAYSAYKEQQVRAEEAKRIEQQSVIAKRLNEARAYLGTSSLTMLPPDKTLDLPAVTGPSSQFVKSIALVQQATREAIESGALAAGKTYTLGGYRPQDLQRQLLGLPQQEITRVNAAGQEEKIVPAINKKAAMELVLKPGQVSEAEKALEQTGEVLRDFIDKTFLKNARSIRKDTEEERRRVINQTAKQLSEKVTLDGVKLDENLIRSRLQDVFLAPDPKNVDQFSNSLIGFKATIRSLGEAAEIAGKTLEALGNTLANVIKSQTSAIERVVSDTKKVFAEFETARSLISTPFKATNLSAIATSPSAKNAGLAATAIKNLTGNQPIDLANQSVLAFEDTLNAFFKEFALASDETKALLIERLSPEEAKKIGGINIERLQEEGPSTEKALASASDFISLVDQSYGELEKLGPAGESLLKILRQGVEGNLPFDVTKLPEALRSGDVNSAAKILNLTEARTALIEQANTLIALENEKIDQQLKAAEALVSVNQQRIESEIALNQLISENAASVNSYAVNLGLLSQRQAGEINVSASQRSVRKNQQLVSTDISGIGSLISDLKAFQIEFDQFATRRAVGLQPQPRFNIADVVSELTTRAAQFGINTPVTTGDTDVQMRANLAATRAMLENEVKNFETVATQAFRSLGQEVDLISSKIQSQKSVLDTYIGKIFGGSAAESAAAKATISKASGNITDIVQEILTQVPNLSTMGPSEITANPTVAQIARDRLSSMSPMDINAIRELLSAAGPNIFTQAGISGEQGLEIFRAAFADEIAALTGIDVSLTSLGANVTNAQTLLQQVNTVSGQIEQAKIEMDRIAIENAKVMTNEVGNLTKAIAAIPKQIDIVISGIENIKVGFDLTNVQQSLSDIGTKVYERVIERFRDVFNKNNINIPL